MTPTPEWYAADEDDADRVPARNWTLTASEPENAPTPTPEADRAQGALVERLAMRESSYARALISARYREPTKSNPDAHTVRAWLDEARAVMAEADGEIAAEVEAAVSVVRAERDAAKSDATAQMRASQRGWRAADSLRRERDAARAELRAVREKVARVEALRGDWQCGDETCDGDCSGCAYSEDLRAALSDPTTPDQTGGDAPPSIADTCCGKCPGDTCYVDGVTGA